ncbi:T9SS type A sorting domain-containing protein [Flavihumibacter rivuli]|uniref:T9SS type A sorting domain-containing protein n=1 Tax=Flavihumibacter rivuli TaxID=2838156 RepID=UPI001BDE5604|nr:T9SS type A sorting domain-containing protein [Flavihumibacter rivuli]ULQ57508.1 T9SS type A sorting domain-containing protein [Flavihumibacter rivuli]
MKTNYYPLPKLGFAHLRSFFSAVLILLCASTVSSQSIEFSRYSRIRGNVGKKGAEYLFSGAYKDAKGKPLADCIVRIENVSIGTTVKYINQNISGQGLILPAIEFGSNNHLDSVELSFRFVPYGQGFERSEGYSFPFLAVAVTNDEVRNAMPFFEYDMGKKSRPIYGWKGMKGHVERIGTVYRTNAKKPGLVKNVAHTSTEEAVAVYSETINQFRVKIGVNKRFSNEIIYTRFKIDLNPINNEINNILKPMVYDFTAKPSESKAQLSWMIGDNSSIASIDVEKSEDGIEFVKIARIKKNRLPLDGERFQFNDNHASNHALINGYYRLRVTGADGKEQYTKTISVVNPSAKKRVQSLVVYEPEQSKLIFATPANWRQEKVEINVFNDKGEIVRQITELYPGAGIDIDLTDLAQGMYYIHAESNGEYALSSYLYSGTL